MSIGLDAYTKMINDRLKEMDMRYAINNQYTPLVGDYSGLMGGARPRKYILSGNSSSGYPIVYPESYSISAGARRAPKRMSMMARYQEHFLQPTNSGYPSVLSVGGARAKTPKKRVYKKRSMSLTHPGELDFTTKKGSKVHHIQGHYVKSMPRPYQSVSRGGKRRPPSLKQIGRSLKKTFMPVAKTIGKIVAPVLPTVGKELGSLAGESLAEVTENPELAPLGKKVGSKLGQSIGEYGKKQLGGRRKSLSHLIHDTTPKKSHSKTPKKRSSKRGEIVKEVMRKHGLNLPAASKFVKDHGLY